MQSQIDNLCEINEFVAHCNNYATDLGIFQSLDISIHNCINLSFNKKN